MKEEFDKQRTPLSFADFLDQSAVMQLVTPRLVAMAHSVLRPGGFILADNTLWDGHVLEVPSAADRQTQGIEDFNDFVAKDERVERVILPLRDGLTLIRKKE